MPGLPLPWSTCLLLGGLAGACAPAAAPPASVLSGAATTEQRGTPAAAASAAATTETVELRYPPSRTPWLGVEIEDLPAGSPGIRVVRVFRGSPAAKSDLRSGDELLSVGGTRLEAPADLPHLLDGFGVGADVPLSVRRAGEQRLLRVVLEGQPQFEDRLRLAFVGLEAPTISGVVTFQGEAASLAELRGKVVLLEFWAGWCEVCRYLAPTLGRWQRAYRPAGLEVVGVTIDPPDVAARAASRVGMEYTLASDAGGDVTQSYLASQIPAVFVIDRRGVVADVMVGVQAARLDEVHALIARLLDDVDGTSSKGHGG